MFSRSSYLNKQVATQTSVERGVAIIEMAIIMPVLTMIMIFIIDIGIMMIHYMTLTQIAHEGVRLGASIADLGATDKEKAYKCEYTAGSKLCFSPVDLGPSNVNDDMLLPVAYRIVQLTNLERFPFTGDYRIDVKQSQADSQISVLISVKYDSYFSMFDNLPLSVACKGPYLFE